MKNIKKIKCVILDLDGTMYSDGDWSKSDEFNFGFIQKNKLFNGTLEEFRDQDIFNKDWHFEQKIYYTCKMLGLPLQSFIDYMDSDIYNFITEKTRTINPELVHELSKTHRVYVLSDSTYKYVCHYLKLFKIKREWIVDVVVNDYKSDDMSKIHAMRKILEKENIRPSEAIMIGDSYNHDIVPANELKMNNVWVKDVSETEDAIRKIIDSAKG